jgi:hypothetical protein
MSTRDYEDLLKVMVLNNSFRLNHVTMTKPVDSHNFPSGSVATLSIIDAGGRLAGLPCAAFFGPPLEGFDILPPLPAWSFLVESPTGKRAIFDLSFDKNPANITPAIREEFVKFDVPLLDLEKDVSEVLSEAGVSVSSIDSIIWR